MLTLTETDEYLGLRKVQTNDVSLRAAIYSNIDRNCVSDTDRGTIEAIDKSEPYTIALPGKEAEDSPDCLHDADQIVLIGVLYLDDETHGPVPGDPEAGDHVDRFAYIF